MPVIEMGKAAGRQLGVREWVWSAAARLLCPWDFPGKILEWVAMPSFRGSSLSTQGSNLGLLHCRWILYHLSHTETHSFTYIFTHVHIDTTVHIHAQIDFHTFTHRGT